MTSASTYPPDCPSKPPIKILALLRHPSLRTPTTIIKKVSWTWLLGYKRIEWMNSGVHCQSCQAWRRKVSVCHCSTVATLSSLSWPVVCCESLTVLCNAPSPSPLETCSWLQVFLLRESGVFQFSGGNSPYTIYFQWDITFGLIEHCIFLFSVKEKLLEKQKKSQEIPDDAFLDMLMRCQVR